ncbi:MAG: isoprenylcysteine carboxylmethyltransferase family protein [Proteobacteria bacterium]|nr:isoprenylcysteine carboxylmethyltransferase family protein [Pseudomonadota bacterium]
MLDKYIGVLLQYARQDRTPAYRLFSILAGTAVFLALLPGLLLAIAIWLTGSAIPAGPGTARNTLALFFIVSGLILLAWSVITQWMIGSGTPAPMAPTQRLIVKGPYRHCRNPIQLGAIIYYFGLGTLLADLKAGLVMFLLALALGSLYHKYVEEKELLLRFGDEYRAYRDRTPFLLPRFWRSGRK